MMSAVKTTRQARAPKRASPLTHVFPQDLGKRRHRASRESRSHTRAVPAWKRILDDICILISLPVTLPLMALTGFWIKLVSTGPVLFRQERIGLHGKHFTLYKFRSMKSDADSGPHENHFRHIVLSNKPMVKLDLLCDPRLVPGGCLLRAAGLDELPQLLNVLRGEMSLVGPRPCLIEEFRFFSRNQRRRFEVLPGLTGIWQIHGKGVTTFNEMNAMDAHYRRRISPAMDLGIMLRTPLTLMRQLRQTFHHHRAVSRKSGCKSTACGAVAACSIHRST